ncbi:hypothetical protein TRAPUB_997 [Trametes pubescens]|uniref:Uncharacterized protein n=1 Tax=Trametes pubescens TaxID=154538 RepID=A0A1M2VKI6_TRAPU|nr:hypothetical protein TRAPUB_997 [Trametes pubescens]
MVPFKPVKSWSDTLHAYAREHERHDFVITTTHHFTVSTVPDGHWLSPEGEMIVGATVTRGMRAARVYATASMSTIAACSMWCAMGDLSQPRMRGKTASTGKRSSGYII